MDFIELIEDYEDLIDLRQAKEDDKGVSVEQLLKEISEENNPNLQYD